MANWLIGRRAVKGATSISGEAQNARIDRIIEAASRGIERHTRRYFIPRTETRLYRWPPLETAPSDIIYLDQDLISVTTLKTKAQDATPTTIASSDYFTEPNNTGPPYDRIEIDASSTAAFEAGDTSQRSIEIVGSWGYSSDTLSAGSIDDSGGIDATETTVVISDSSLVDVGDTMLIESEQIFVADVTSAALGSILLNDGSVTASQSDKTVTVDGSHGLNVGETILVDSERMFIEDISTNNLTVVRGYDGSTLAAHNDDAAVHVFRTLTVERGVNGTTGATHSNSTAISVYEPPFDIRQLTLAESIAAYSQELDGWAAGASANRNLVELRAEVLGGYRRMREAAI
jgi:hypothetical protein